MKRFLVLSFLMSVVLVMACDDSDSGNKYTVNLNHSSVADGTKGYAKFVAFTDGCSGTALYFAEAVFSSGSAVATINDIADGNYRGCIFVDNNGSASGANTSMPDDGDYFVDSGGDSAIVVPDSKSVVIDEEDWTTIVIH